MFNRAVNYLVLNNKIDNILSLPLQLEQMLNKFGVSQGIKGTRATVTRLCKDVHQRAIDWRDSVAVSIDKFITEHSMHNYAQKLSTQK